MSSVSKEMILYDVMKKYPSTVKVFDSYHMSCKSCSGGHYETVGWGAMTHGVDLKKLLDKLNNAAK